ncbi:MAG: hypothetical protein ABI193_06425, partial [Minicystis sp.]
EGFPTGPVNTASPSGCTLVGAWAGNYPPGPYPFSGRPLTLTFNADGSASRDSEHTKSEFVWTMEGPAVSFHGKKTEGGGRTSCTPEDIAKANVEFAPDCSGFTVKMISDPCKTRSQVLNGITVKKQ